MTVANDLTSRGHPHGHSALVDRFEVLKEIGDGSFGSVILARVRTAGANVARRGSVVRLTARSNAASPASRSFLTFFFVNKYRLPSNP